MRNIWEIPGDSLHSAKSQFRCFHGDRPACPQIINGDRYDHSALHWNKSECNYHIHLIYSERRPLENPDIRIASRNMFYDENGKRRRTKKEILDEQGNVRPGCRIIRKGEEYKCRFFGPKEDFVGASRFLDEVKHMYTDVINACIKDESERLTEFDRNGHILQRKRLGRTIPRQM